MATTASEYPVSRNTGWQNSLDISVNEILAMDNFHFSRFRNLKSKISNVNLTGCFGISSFFIYIKHFLAITASEEPVSRNTGWQSSLDISVNEILAMDNFHICRFRTLKSEIVLNFLFLTIFLPFCLHLPQKFSWYLDDSMNEILAMDNFQSCKQDFFLNFLTWIFFSFLDLKQSFRITNANL